MKYFFITFFSMILMFLSFVGVVKAEEENRQNYEMGKVTIAGFSTNDINNLFDNNTQTTISMSSGKTGTYTFPKTTNISAVKLAGNDRNITIKFYDSANLLLGTMSPSTNVYRPVDYKNVKKFVIAHDKSVYSRTLSEFNLMLYEIDIIPPEVPSKITYNSDVNAVNLSWKANEEIDLNGYNVYVNGLKRNVALIKSNSFTIDNLKSGVYYAIQVSAVDLSANESSKSSVLQVTPFSEEIKPILEINNITHNSISLQWDRVANDFEIYLNGNLVKKQNTITFTLSNLVPLTNYEVKVIAIDQFKRRVESNIQYITTKIKTIDKPIFTISNLTNNSFDITYKADTVVSTYDIYLNDSLIINTTSLNYSFTNLIDNTVYKIKLVAKNIDSQNEYILSTTTKKNPIPAVTSLKSSTKPSNDNTVNKQLDFTTTEDVKTVDLFINGQYVDTFPKGAPINLDNIDNSQSMLDIELKPTGGGESYKLIVPIKTTGNDAIDEITSEMTTSYSFIKKAFLYLAIASIPLFLIVILFFWLRKRFKPMLLSSEDNKPFETATNNKNSKNQSKSKAFTVDTTRQEKFIYQPRKKHYEEHGMKVNSVEEKYIPNLFGYTKKVNITYKKDDVIYKSVYRKGQGRVYQPIDAKNQFKHIGNQMNNIKKSLSVNHKKIK